MRELFFGTLWLRVRFLRYLAEVQEQAYEAALRGSDKRLVRNCCLFDVGHFIQAGGVARRAMLLAHLPALCASGCRIPARFLTICLMTVPICKCDQVCKRAHPRLVGPVTFSRKARLMLPG